MTARIQFALAVGAGALLSPAAAVAAPVEPLVVTQLSDPDPSYVPPKTVPVKKGRRTRQQADENTSLDKAMENLGMVIGQAAEFERRRDGASSEQIAAEKREVMRRLQERMAGTRPD